MSERFWPLAAGVALGALGVLFVPSCLERRDDELASPADQACASCHGNPERAGDRLQKSAPPGDLSGASHPSYPGVGAHAIHVYASDTHAAVACSECHRVPEHVNDPGHADDALPAELVFGELAKTGGRNPSYDFVARSCSDSWCHRDARAVWTEPRSSAQACGSCHGLPPPEPHPQSDRCESCHAEVIDADRRFIAPALHVDGKIQFSAGGCGDCHGSGSDPAPPPDTSGSTSPTAIGVGAHAVHLSGGASGRALACGECHVVPTAVDSPGHADALPAEVVFTGVATASSHTPTWDRALLRCADSWCHGPSAASVAPSPEWTSAAPLGCGSCHGTPPPAPHPQIDDCSRCHGDVVAPDDVSIMDRSRHVDGVVDLAFDTACTACHGSVNPAPPVDLSGATATTSAGVGAHQTHVLGTVRARAVPCAECHSVPSTVLEAGHVDSFPPAELIFSGAAVAFGGAPSYAAGSCQNTSCHGGVFPKGHASGGSNTAPVWTTVDGSQSACGTCHGLPPPPPHPLGSLNPVCSACHENIASDNLTFVNPELHVDGVVTFTVP